MPALVITADGDVKPASVPASDSLLAACRKPLRDSAPTDLTSLIMVTP